jgi:hypothetical protein
MEASVGAIRHLIVGVAALSIATASFAQQPPEAPPKWYDAFRIGGFVDGNYIWNTNRPQSHDNFIPGTGTTGKRANEFGLNLAAIEIVSDPKPVGIHLTLVAGSGAEVVHLSEPGSSSTGPSVFRNIYQASVSYNVPVGRGLLLEAGTYPSHVGFEGFFSKDNWLYTRSWLGEFSPYYQTGLKAAYGFNDRWSGQVHILNGWQIIGDNNNAKTIGTQVAYNGGRLSASFNTLAGPELPNDDTHMRLFGDLVATYKVTPKLTFAGSADRGRQDLPGGSAANWFGIAAYGHYEFNAQHALSGRVETFRDPDNGISGYAQTLREATLNYQYNAAPGLILKFGARHDHSTASVFDRGAGEKSQNQTIALIGAVVKFGG